MISVQKFLGTANPTGNKRIPDGILSMFPLENTQANVPPIPTFSSDYHIPLQPKDGPHNEIYTIYRTSSTPPLVLHRMTQRGASVIGVEEDTLRYSIHWLESKLKRKSQNQQDHEI
jgi:hypothetical protein